MTYEIVEHSLRVKDESPPSNKTYPQLGSSEAIKQTREDNQNKLYNFDYEASFEKDREFYKDIIRMSDMGFKGYVIIREKEENEHFKIKLDGEGNIEEYEGDVVFEEKPSNKIRVSDMILKEI